VHLLDGTLENTFNHHAGGIRAIVALPDNQHALSGSWDDTVKLFNVNDGAVLRNFPHVKGRVASMALLPDGLRFVSCSTYGDYVTTPESRVIAHVAYHGCASGM
jgi:WD40 repeat protein